MTLKDKIYQLCKERDMTVRELEREADLKERTIQHWDKSEPSAYKLQRVADVLKVPIEELLSVYNPNLERLAYIETLRMENEELKKSSTVLSEEEKELIKLYRKADEHDKATILMLLSRYKEDTVSAVG